MPKERITSLVSCFEKKRFFSKKMNFFLGAQKGCGVMLLLCSVKKIKGVH